MRPRTRRGGLARARGASLGLAVAFGLAAVCAAAAPGRAQQPAAEAVLAELPFLPDPNPNAIFLDLAREGSERGLRLQLDTGATSSVITSGMARDLGVSERRLKTTPYRRSTRLGRDLQFHIRDSSGAPSPLEFGLLGGNFLSHYVVEIDYPARRVRFLDPDRYAVPEQPVAEGARVLPLRIVARRPVVEIEVDDEPIAALLDTGAPVGLIIGGRSVGKLGLEPRVLLGLRLFGVMGEVKTGFAEARRVRFGGFDFAHVPLVLAPRGLHQQATASDSTVGHDLLSDFVLRIDYPRARLWLTRGGEREARLLGLDWGPARKCGALLEPDGEYMRVRFVVEGSPADALGLVPNDVIEGRVGSSVLGDAAAVAAAITSGSGVRVLRLASDGRWRPTVMSGPLP